jgi:tetratricopeptide (TPR) repeat protein
MSESEGGLFELAAVRARVAAEAAEDPEAARLLYTEEIFAWTDAFSEEEPGGEQGEGEGEGGQRRARLQAIGRLWTRYAAMEQQLKQWKKAVQVFEDALQDEVANRCLELYLAYVSFYRARGKISSAQKVLVRALAAAGPLHCPPQPPVRVYLPATAGAVSNDGEF